MQDAWINLHQWQAVLLQDLHESPERRGHYLYRVVTVGYPGRPSSAPGILAHTLWPLTMLGPAWAAPDSPLWATLVMTRFRNAVLNVLTVVLTIAAVFVLGEQAKARFFPPDVTNPTDVSSWSNELRQGGLRLGRSDLENSVVVFADYQCPFCKVTDEVLDSLSAVLGDSLVVTYRHFPLTIHDSAGAAARVAECAAEHGVFPQVHRSLYQFADSIGKRGWRWFLEVADVPSSDGIMSCVDSDRVFPSISQDMALGDSLGIVATPTIVIGTTLYTGMGPRERFADRVAAGMRGENE